MPGGARRKSQSAPLVRGIQCGLQGDTGLSSEYGDCPSELRMEPYALRPVQPTRHLPTFDGAALWRPATPVCLVVS